MIRKPDKLVFSMCNSYNCMNSSKNMEFQGEKKNDYSGTLSVSVLKLDQKLFFS